MLKVECEVEVIEFDDKNVSDENIKPLPFKVEAHWNDNDLVVLQIGQHTYTLIASELIKAIENATNI